MTIDFYNIGKNVQSMRYLATFSLIFIFLLTGIQEVEAQKKRRKRPSDRDRQEKVDKPSFTDKLYYEFKFGNIGLGSTFQIASKPTIGYSFTNRLSANLSFKNRYIFENFQNAPDRSFFDYGFGPGARFKITETIYLGGEYLYNSIDLNSSRINTWGTGIGGGYFSGQGPWTFGIEIMFQLNDTIRNAENVVGDYWIGFSYNF